jgi:sec-independent protein translocase protein TatC
MTGAAGEMPFLDHLEELRARILRSLAAILIGFGIGFFLVQRFQLVSLMKEPIAPYLTDGRLTVLSPTDPVLIVFKLALLVGLVLASPVIIWQVWAFLAPGLYARERRAIVPALFIGSGLFMTGSVLAYLIVVPQALRVLFSFQSEALIPMITYGAYFDFVLQIVLALGLSFELPLIIVILAALGVVTPMHLHRFRRYAVVGAFLAGAILSPGADILSMLLMTIPLLVLYEVGFVGALLIHRRRVRHAAAGVAVIAMLLAAGASPAAAQDSVPPRRDPVPAAQADTTRILPERPSREFGTPDSAMNALMAQPGYRTVRFRADSATLYVEQERIDLQREALVQREQVLLEADRITYEDPACMFEASGSPRLFDNQQVLVGSAIRYDVCARRGVVDEALTTFEEGAATWFIRGTVANDSTANRIYAASAGITSCDLPEPHYRFSAGEVKWISKDVLVARPVVLYVRDVPVLWLPFLFQDLRPGRRSGILVPQFGLNDIVRPSGGYQRQVTNIGYYWAASDYIDLLGRMDWYSGRYVQVGLQSDYRWLDRFMSGSLALDRTWETEGSSSFGARWSHRQEFSLATSINLDLNYVSRTAVLGRNAIDPRLNTQQITSSANLQRRFGWGTVTLGGTRRQSVSDDAVSTQFPALTVSPKPIDISRSITWSPNLRVVNDMNSGIDNRPRFVLRPDGTIDSTDQEVRNRNTNLSLETPFRLGSFTWRNSITAFDRTTRGRSALPFRVPNEATPDPLDSLNVTEYYFGDFASGANWETGLGLPTLFRTSWKLQPAVNIANVVPGQPFALRNRATSGDWVTQGKRLSFSLAASPTFFGFLNGIGPVSGIRHAVSPLVAFTFAPEATVPEDYVRALTPVGEPTFTAGAATRSLSVGLQQTFEAKRRVSASDSAAQTTQPGQAPKFRLLSIGTSPLVYDFEQAEEEGRSGWVTRGITNNLLSDLLPSFNLSLTHDLWRGDHRSDTAHFEPFLQRVSASFAVTERTFAGIGRLLGLGSSDPSPGPGRNDLPPQMDRGYDAFGRDQGRYNTSRYPLNSRRGGFSANLNYSLDRQRPVEGVAQLTPDRQSVGFQTLFSPTAFWTVSWGGQYNLTEGQFESQEVRLERDLHEWRAGFNFVRNANGNFALYFSIYLMDLPDLKFDYDQRTIER